MNSVIKLAAATVTVVSALGFGLGIVSGSSTLANCGGGVHSVNLAGDRGGSVDSVPTGDRGGSMDSVPTGDRGGSVD